MSRRVCKIMASNVGKTSNKDVKIVTKNVRNEEKPDRKDDKNANRIFKNAERDVRKNVRTEEKSGRKGDRTVDRIFKDVEKDVRKNVRNEEKPGRKDGKTVDRIHGKGVVNVESEDEKSLAKSKVKSEVARVEAKGEWVNNGEVRVEAKRAWANSAVVNAVVGKAERTRVVVNVKEVRDKTKTIFNNAGSFFPLQIADPVLRGILIFVPGFLEPVIFHEWC